MSTITKLRTKLGALTCDPTASNKIGIGLALISTLLFTLVAVLVKQLSTSIDVFQILLFRQMIFLAVLLPAIYQNIHIILKPTNIKLHSFRILGAFTALYLGFITVSNIPLADATALGFTQVLFVAVISRIYLAESLTTSRITTIAVGFIGVMLVVQPGFDDSPLLYIALGMLGALGAATAVICVRKVAQVEPKITLLAYQAFFVGAFAFIPSMFTWTWPDPQQLLQLVAVGFLSSIAQWVGISAYRYGQANVISNVEYAKIIYSLLLGFLIFGEQPNSLAIVGMLVVISSSAVPLIIKNRSRAQSC
ncbi:DMT family transporter [Vibrio superstes]|uniref:Permease n=1 Tax=Vibrio superstes NBRC 103154 TaxID=1219062 RepID=A0A511QP44_9VIBR|nr:DMT family transporter [Vibrio superstes]GEM79099.1 permease [Vibrio superstes NBRC 103154]